MAEGGRHVIVLDTGEEEAENALGAPGPAQHGPERAAQGPELRVAAQITDAALPYVLHRSRLPGHLPVTLDGAWDDAWGTDGLRDDWGRGKRSDTFFSANARDPRCTPHARPYSRDVPAESKRAMYNPELLRRIVVRAGKSFLLFDDRVEVREAASERLLQTVVYTDAMRGPWRAQSFDVTTDATLLLIGVVAVTRTLADYEDGGDEPARKDLYVVDLDVQQDERVEPRLLPCPGDFFCRQRDGSIVGGRLLPAKWFTAGEGVLHGVIALRGPRFGETVVPTAGLSWAVVFVRHPCDLRDMAVWCWSDDARKLFEVSRDGDAKLLYEESLESRFCAASVHVEGLAAISTSHRTRVLCPSLGRECDVPASAMPVWRGDVLVDNFARDERFVWDGGEWVRDVRQHRERAHGGRLRESEAASSSAPSTARSTPTKVGDEGVEERDEDSKGADAAAAAAPAAAGGGSWDAAATGPTAKRARTEEQ
jgi:hypothetical protein